jgi:hypothetical protein
MKFNNFSHDEKLELQKKLNESIKKIGGQFNFLKMLEDVREAQRHPLTNKTGKFHFATGTINWDKHIYEDKIDVLKQVVINAPKNNLLSVEKEKLRKQLLNAVKTIVNLEFVVKNKNIKDGEGFTFKPFQTITDDNIEFDPLFQIIFFDGVNNTKKILKYK